MSWWKKALFITGGVVLGAIVGGLAFPLIVATPVVATVGGILVTTEFSILGGLVGGGVGLLAAKVINPWKNKSADKSSDSGMSSYNQSQYDETSNNSQKAYDKDSANHNNRSIFKDNTSKKCEEAKTQVLEQGDALIVNKAAEQQFPTSEKIDTYKNGINKATSKLYEDLHNLWKKGWEAEENDRLEEATEFFQKVLDKAKEYLQKFPDNSKLKQYKTFASLKIEGNELFNKALELQQNGVKLLTEAEKLNQQEKYDLAGTKFKEAKNKFSASIEKFKIGSQNDQRFKSCIQSVQEQIKEVEQSIEQHQHQLNQVLNNLNITIDSNDLNQDESHEVHVSGDCAFIQ